MAKKKDEKDVLVVRDEKTGEISVVAGLNASTVLLKFTRFRIELFFPSVK